MPAGRQLPELESNRIKSELKFGCILEPTTPNPSPSPPASSHQARCRGVRARAAGNSEGGRGNERGDFRWVIVCRGVLYCVCAMVVHLIMSLFVMVIRPIYHTLSGQTPNNSPARRSQRVAILSHFLQHSPFWKMMRKIVKWANRIPFFRCLFF